MVENEGKNTTSRFAIEFVSKSEETKEYKRAPHYNKPMMFYAFYSHCCCMNHDVSFEIGPNFC